MGRQRRQKLEESCSANLGSRGFSDRGKAYARVGRRVIKAGAADAHDARPASRTGAADAPDARLGLPD